MLARTPPLGWNSWNTFGPDICEAVVLETADAFVEKGYQAAGYEYVVLDDCWSLRERDADGKLVADPEKFPHGMRYVADYIHARGLKFGMYSCAGTRTCAGYPGSYDHEFDDARTFADWGVDFLKYDFCNFPACADGPSRYRRMSMALKATGRPILFSACSWGSDDPWKWMASAGAQMYRSTGDIHDNYVSFRDIALSQIDKLCMSGAGCFNDPDMLVVGMYGKGHVGLGGCTDAEYRTHFVLWCLFGVPLMMGGDLRQMNDFSRELLQNPRLLRINQDEECRPPYLAEQCDGRYFFVRHLSDNEFALAYINLSDNDAPVYRFSASFDQIGLPLSSGYGLHLTDAVTGADIGHVQDYFMPAAEAHSSVIYLARLEKNA